MTAGHTHTVRAVGGSRDRRDLTDAAEIIDLMARDIRAALRARHRHADLIAAGWTNEQCLRFGDAALTTLAHAMMEDR